MYAPTYCNPLTKRRYNNQPLLQYQSFSHQNFESLPLKNTPKESIGEKKGILRGTIISRWIQTKKRFNGYVHSTTVSQSFIAFQYHYKNTLDMSDSGMGLEDNSNISSSAYSYGKNGKGGNNSTSLNSNQDDFMMLTKQLIEVRNILKTVNQNCSALQLPSIVVIGSQSSGKSSVLEAIVGHEFLPKGNNMVTRRPIELTLVHTPNAEEEYGEFPEIGINNVTDFTQIQRTLSDLNMSVSESECISTDPIELKIYSPTVPDLTLIDLPGYIQVINRKQPPILKRKIVELCDRYIVEPNIILAISSADVDLANSEALTHSRKVDPYGKRTIGVITKMDLVDPEKGVDLLINNDYPLELGYVGMVCKPPGKSGFSRQLSLTQKSDQYFRSNPIFHQPDVQVGLTALKKRLTTILEENMGQNLYGIVDAVQNELEEVRYQYKVQYNDRHITAESYTADIMDTLKHQFKEFSNNFGKAEVREEIQNMLEEKIMEICKELYYDDPKVAAFPSLCLKDLVWKSKVDMSSAALTKSGIGRATTQLVVDIVLDELREIASKEPFTYHESTCDKIIDFSSKLLKKKFHTTVDQVENTIKPLKFEVECTDLEWERGKERAINLVDRHIQESQKKLQDIRSQVGRRKLRTAVKYLRHQNQKKINSHKPVTPTPTPKKEETKPSDETLIPEQLSTSLDNLEEEEEAQILKKEMTKPRQYNPILIEKAKEAMELRKEIAVLKGRAAALRSRQCSGSNGKSCCPEAFLSVISQKLANSAVMFIQIELLNEFMFQFPREVDNKLYYDLSREQVNQFACENPTIRRHIELQKRKDALELVMDKLVYLVRRQNELIRRKELNSK
jgi:GTP-binding protein EngB required for normal cell division